MRLALALGRTVGELEETLPHAEWVRWLSFHNLFDLPDGFLVTGQLGSVVAGAIGSDRAKPEHFAPYYEPPKSPSKSRAGALASVRALVNAALARHQPR